MRTLISLILITSAGIFVAFGFIVLYGQLWSGAYDNIVYEKGDRDLYAADDPTVDTIEVDVAQANDRSVQILFGGDMMFDRYIRQMATQGGYGTVFSELASLIDAHDCVIANVEGPITDNPSVSVFSEIGTPENYRFTFDPIVASVLADNNFCLTNIGNNHIGNFGPDGVISTKRYLNEAGVGYFGDTHTLDEDRYIVYEINDVRLGLVNYNAFVPDADEHAIQDLQSVLGKNVDFVIVYTHWGNEYEQSPQQEEIELAHRFIDAGADLIIGSHPHVVQSVEEYNGKMIYYSLGNFIFDQYFSRDTQRGLLVSVTLDVGDRTLMFEDHDIELLPTGKVQLIRDEN
jgi:poly-gamma-glutamate synthesis protein (capsule biosynthesis protein)